MHFFPPLPLLQRAMKKDGAASFPAAAASTTPKDVDVDVDGLLKRLEEMEAGTKRLEEALEADRRELYDSYDVHENIIKAVAKEQDIRVRTVRDLRALERKMDEELACARLLCRLVKLS